MKYVWEDLPEKKNCFTVRNAVMVNLNNGKIIRHYAPNTKIVVVQKCVTPDKTYYRTYEAFHHYLNYAFEASAFGLPNEVAPSVPSHRSNSSSTHTSKLRKPGNRALPRDKKQTDIQKNESSKGGGETHHKGWLSRLFRRNK